MDNILQHFRPDEKEFIEQVLDWKQEVEMMYAAKITDFLDPRQRAIVSTLIGQNQAVRSEENGAFSQSERARVCLYPDYYQPEIEDFQLTVFELRFPEKFVQLKHPDVLGALLSLGLQRTKFGDIRIATGKVQFVVATEVAQYVRVNLQAIGKTKTTLKELETTDVLLETEEQWKSSTITASSLRLDTVIATAFAISRQKAALLIDSGKVKVNFMQCENVSFELQEFDLLSIRQIGRMKIESIEGRTKKDKLRLKILKLERKS